MENLLTALEIVACVYGICYIAIEYLHRRQYNEPFIKSWWLDFKTEDKIIVLLVLPLWLMFMCGEEENETKE